MPWGRLDRFRRETPALVALVPSKRDWRILETEHWYRIPVATAPDGIESVRWLAFYLPAAFGPDKWSVSRLGRVRSLRRCLRRELIPSEPGHPRADQPYWRVELESLARLDRPIPSRRRRRVVFIPTSLERLRAAREINDLYRTSPIEDRLYACLRDGGEEPERQFFVRDAETDLGAFVDIALFCRDGRIAVECDGDRWHANPSRAELDRLRDNALTAGGWRILRFSGREINGRVEDCAKTVRRTITRLGGPLPAPSPGRSGLTARGKAK